MVTRYIKACVGRCFRAAAMNGRQHKVVAVILILTLLGAVIKRDAIVSSFLVHFDGFDTSVVDPRYGDQKCNSTGVWTWKCQSGRCVRKEMSPTSSLIELNTCKLTCGKYTVLFPRPSGYTKIGGSAVPFLPSSMKLIPPLCGSLHCPTIVNSLVHNAFSRFQETLVNAFITESKKKKRRPSSVCLHERSRSIHIMVNLTTSESNLSLDTDESSSITISSGRRDTSINIIAKTFFGARHALETASQLTAYRESHDSLQIVSEVSIIDDKPAYRYRGLLLDTSRNYYSVESILKLITSLSYSKMNTLHWHITDAASFPMEIPSVPELSQYGAYSSERIYTPDDVRKIVKHGLINGVRILPEFDQPSHCSQGWEFGPKMGLGNLTVCLNKRPWQKYCVTPPCGQLNPTNPKLYEVLGKIYKTFIELFSPDIFHTGGDEVDLRCWRSSEEITSWMYKRYGSLDERNFLKLWGSFLNNSSKKLTEANGNKEIPIIVWSSTMTKPQYLTEHLDPRKHIIQIWENTKSQQIQNIVRNGFRTIFSTHDTLYLDCGYGNWLGKGNNWCSPYKDWTKFYESDPVRILNSQGMKVTESIRKSILGQEAAMWSEQVDDQAHESKIWPRTAALAERLWSDPREPWRAALDRLLYHRQRLVDRGIHADIIQPHWCMQNSGLCD